MLDSPLTPHTQPVDDARRSADDQRLTVFNKYTTSIHIAIYIDIHIPIWILVHMLSIALLIVV